jgi:DNA repair protein SbcD/Mre11
MRIIHVSDWHIGRSTLGVSRRPDLEVVLEEIATIASDYKPHLILHSGDLFETPRPLVEDIRFAQESLSRLAAIAPTLVIAGNHDSPQLFDVFDRFLGEKSRLRFIGQPRSPQKGGIISYPGDSGEIARVATMPFVYANRMVEALETSAAQRTMAYADRLTRIQNGYAQSLGKDFQIKKHILLYTAHLFVDGATLSRSERALHVSETYATRTSSIPPVTYAAFGHIHKPQALPGGLAGRYAGSPIPLDYGEAGEQKEIVLIEARPGQQALITPVPLKGGRPLLHLRGSQSQLEELAQTTGSCLLRLTVELEKPTNGLADWASRAFPKAMLIDVSESILNRPNQKPLAPPALNTNEMEDLFRQYLDEFPHPQWSTEVLYNQFVTVWKASELRLEEQENPPPQPADSLEGAAECAL